MSPMDPKRWSRPVTYEADDRGHYRTIGSTREAAETLMRRWPADRGRQYRRAQKTFLAVLEGKAAPSEARAAFLAAAAEADVFVRE